MKAWADRFGLPDRYLAIDTETSKLGPDAAVLHLGWCLFEHGDAVLSTGAAIGWPDVLDAVSTTKLGSDMAQTRRAMEARGNAYRWTLDELRRVGQAPQEVVRRFTSDRGELPICAHHGWGFDYPLLARLIEGQTGKAFDPVHTDLLDTCLMARAMLSGSVPRPTETYYAFVRRMGEVRCAKHTLRDCAAMCDLHLKGVDFKHAHDAEYDAWVCGLVFEQFKRVAAGTPEPDADAMII